MAHFYNCTKIKQPFLEKEITTPSQAKKHKDKIFPSITTLIGSTIKDPFLDSVHKPRSMVKYARMEEYADLDWKDIEQLCYGLVESPDGRMIPSSEFGTSVHNSCEKLLNALKFGDDEYEPSMYDEYAQPFIDWVQENNYKIIGTEYPIADNLIKTCGTIDVVLKDETQNHIFICDYKCRKSRQFYDKDLWQMAIECEMIRRRGLDYLPSCISVCIDINTKQHHHKKWTEEQMKKAIQIVKYISKLYWAIRM
jgi:hypothetical protein